MPAFVWLILVLGLAAPLAYLGGHVRVRAAANLPQWIALVACAAAWILFIQAVRAGDAVFRLGTIALEFDGIAMLLTAVALALGTLALIFSGAYLRDQAGTEKFFAQLLVLIGALIGLGAAGDLFNLWMWFELVAVASYTLVVFFRHQPASLEAGVKYLVQSATGSVLVLLGIALLFAQSGTLDLAQMQTQLMRANENLVFAAVGLFVIGFGVKAALVPLHTWLPDAHAQAPSSISAMLSGVVIEAALIAMLRATAPCSALLSGSQLPGGNSLALLLVLFGAVNMLAGNLLALRQNRVKRLLAFSSVAQVGYIVFGLGISVWDGEGAGAQGAFFHLINHGLMKSLAFFTAGALLFAMSTALANHETLTIADLSGTARRYPLAAFAFSVALLGLAGLPPLAGFMSKWQIFAAGFEARNIWLEALVLFAALNSVLSLAYYMPLVNVMYRGKVSPSVARGDRIPRSMLAPAALLTLGVFVIGIAPDVVTWLTAPASAALMRSLGY